MERLFFYNKPLFVVFVQNVSEIIFLLKLPIQVSIILDLFCVYQRAFLLCSVELHHLTTEHLLYVPNVELKVLETHGVSCLR